MMDIERFCENLARLQSRIVFVGVVDNRRKLVYSAFREVRFYAQREGVDNFMMLSPSLVVDELEKIEPMFGRVRSVLVRYDRQVFVFSRVTDYVVVVGLNTEVPTPFPEYIDGLMKTAAKRSKQEQKITIQV